MVAVELLDCRLKGKLLTLSDGVPELSSGKQLLQSSSSLSIMYTSNAKSLEDSLLWRLVFLDAADGKVSLDLELPTPIGELSGDDQLSCSHGNKAKAKKNKIYRPLKNVSLRHMIMIRQMKQSLVLSA